MKARILACFGLTVCTALAAQTAGDHVPLVQDVGIEPPPQGVSLAWENDLWAFKNKTDRWFTNGIHFAWSLKRPTAGQLEAEDFAAIRAIGRKLLTPRDCPESADDRRKRLDCDVTLTYAIGQNMYTPRSTDLASPQLSDRPWAAWLYVGGGFSHYKGNRHQMLSLKLGATGPVALGEPAQAFVHRYISHSPKPLGWDNQLRPRLRGQVSYITTSRYTIADAIGVQVSLGGTLGNTRTQARAGLGAYWSPSRSDLSRHQAGTLDEGEFLVPDFNSKATNGTIADSLRRTVFYAHIQAAAVGYNAFIEGDTFAGRPRVKLIRDVYTSTFGLSIPLGERGQHKVGMAFKRRSPEFSVRGEVGRDFYQRWGVLTYSYDFDS